MITDRNYSKGDFKLVRDFFSDVFKNFDVPVNWFIDRFSFTYAFSTAMRDKSEMYWEEHTHLWFEGDDLIALANTEGEDGHEAFIHVRSFDVDQKVLEAMFEFVEKKLMQEKDGMMLVNLRISSVFKRALEEAKFRGYKEQDWDEVTLMCSLNSDFEVDLPLGFELVSGNHLSPVDKGDVHSRAFEYSDDDYFKRRTPIGFAIMAQLPDYIPELELFVVNGDGLPVAFCNLWFDEKNQLAVLEPVGCDPEFRRNGLAKACIYEGMNRVRAMGAKRVYVGSNQQFYKSIGFSEVSRSNIMQLIE